MAGAVRLRLTLTVVVALVLPLKAETIGDPVASRSAEAQAHYQAGRYEEALRAYRDALVERPKSGALHLNVGDALYELGDYDNALQEFERAAAAADADLSARGYYNKGNTHFKLQDYAAAVEAYKESLERSPRDTDAKANLELALQLLQTPPPQSQEGGDDSEKTDKDEQDESSDAEENSESGQESAGEDESEGEHPPEEQEATPPEAGEDDEADDSDPDESPADSPDESEQMDEDEAEQLLDALNDRDAQSQQRRYRAKRRGDDTQDW